MEPHFYCLVEGVGIEKKHGKITFVVNLEAEWNQVFIKLKKFIPWSFVWMKL